MVRAVFAALLALLLAVPAAAQGMAAPGAPDMRALDWLVGDWRGSGTMMGNPSEATLSVRPVLGGRFLELSYRAGPFEGRAFYSIVATGRWRATWFDNRGISFPIEAREIEHTLTSDWGSAETEQGRTEYILSDNGSLRVTDSVRRGGAYREFARHVLTRTP